jgi:hypothetical protein
MRDKFLNVPLLTKKFQSRKAGRIPAPFNITLHLPFTLLDEVMGERK